MTCARYVRRRKKQQTRRGVTVATTRGYNDITRRTGREEISWRGGQWELQRYDVFTMQKAPNLGSGLIQCRPVVVMVLFSAETLASIWAFAFFMWGYLRILGSMTKRYNKAPTSVTESLKKILK